MSRAAAAILGLCVLLLAACSSPKRPGELPATASIVGSHNARVADVESLWARTSVRVEGRDAEGSRFAEQGEGHLQVERPDRVAVTVGKLGEVYFALGSGPDRYWLIDVSGSDRRVMLVGEQSLATPAKAETLGLPVHPRDIPMLIGLLPLDASTLGEPAWDDDGRAVLTVPTRWGSADLRYDPRTLDLVASNAYDAGGALVAAAELGLHGPVTDRQGLTEIGRLPRRIEVRVPGFEGFMRMQLGEAQVRPINGAVFDAERLRRAYRVNEVIDLDSVEWDGAEKDTDG